MNRKWYIILFLVLFIAVIPQAYSNDIGSAIGDWVWYDLDSDGIQEIGEPGFSGAVVELHTNQSATNVIASVTTDGSGTYWFSNLENSTYDVFWLKFILPSGYFFTDQNIGVDETIDSDADVFTGIVGDIAGISLEGLPNFDLDAGVRAVPIPAAIYLLGAGFVGLAGLRRKLKI